ncbi:MAG: RNA polymerase sigma factor [Rhodospirillales bacterium]|nr:RNA polymerase sigma factor [Rhodospirillales bacterium]
MDGTEPTVFDDTSVVERLRHGDRLAAELVIRRHNQALWRIARSILRHDQDAEDAIQETYLRAFSQIGNFRGEAGLGTWLARIAVNEALRGLTKRRVTSGFAESADGRGLPPPAAPGNRPVQSPEQLASRREIRRLVEGAVDRLPTPFRVVFVMRVVEQMSISETAAALNVPAATVKTRLHRAIQQLRPALSEDLAAALQGAFPFDGERCERLTKAVLLRLPSFSMTGNLSSPRQV